MRVHGGECGRKRNNGGMGPSAKELTAFHKNSLIKIKDKREYETLENTKTHGEWLM